MVKNNKDKIDRRMKQQFGKNFKQNLLNAYDETRLNQSIRFIQEYLETETLEGKTFLDAGCGSGVFSIAAQKMGAKVTSFDIDETALVNISELKQLFEVDDKDIILKKGNILDQSFIKSLGQFDVVLCWGVVHHCGDMWKALDLISQTTNKNGIIHLGIYNEADGWGIYPDGRFGPSTFWRKIKKFYSRLPSLLQSFIDLFCIIGISVIYLLMLKNPIKKLRENERRGMTWKSDLKDWLIGYPYEYARPEQVFEFMKKRNFTLVKIKTNNGLLTNNYVFQSSTK